MRKQTQMDHTLSYHYQPLLLHFSTPSFSPIGSVFDAIAIITREENIFLTRIFGQE